MCLLFLFFYDGECTSLSFGGNSGRPNWARHGSRKSSATHSYQCVQYFPVSRQWYGCQCLGFLTCTQMLMHAIAHRGCTDTVRESALKADWDKNPLPYQGLKPVPVFAPGFSVGCSTSWAIPAPVCVSLNDWFSLYFIYKYTFYTLLWVLVE